VKCDADINIGTAPARNIGALPGRSVSFVTPFMVGLKLDLGWGVNVSYKGSAERGVFRESSVFTQQFE
jgi:hypothetical protein